MSLTSTSKRLVSLDVLRGITVCGMILVNNAGACGYAYAPLKHAKWDGFTPADLVFPAFMFIMGVSIYLSLNKSNFDWRVSIARILRRTALIFVSGVSSNGFWRLLLPVNTIRLKIYGLWVYCSDWESVTGL